MRYMARVVTIKQVFPIEGKDKIQKAIFNEHGYEAIISKNLNIGDSVVWIEADSILPVKPQWEFLRKRCYNEKVNGFLIKPMTMAKVKSWGLVVTFDEAGIHNEAKMLHPGDDITDLLEIKKYEPIEDASPKKEQSSKKSKYLKFLLDHTLTRWLGKILLYFKKKKEEKEVKFKGFPEYIISKSDEDTIQNHPDYLEKHAEEAVYVTTKMEGQSVTACFDYDYKKKKIGNFFVCSRNTAYRTETNNRFWEFAIKHNLKEKLIKYYNKTGKLLCIQAEQCGPGIQQNIYNFNETQWFVYSIKDEVTGNQLPFSAIGSICEELELKHVPLIAYDVKLKEIMPTLDEAVKYASDKCFIFNDKKELHQTKLSDKPNRTLWKNIFLNEGIVVRSIDYEKDKNIGFSFKVKNIEYAEKGLGKINSAVKTFLDSVK